MAKYRKIAVPEFDENEEYLSGEVQEILGQPPHWLSTWGTAAIVCCLAILIVVSIIFSYPDIVHGDFVLKTSQPPVPVVTLSSGYLAEIRVGEGDVIEKDNIIAVFASNASADDVLKLENEVGKLSEFDLETLQLFLPDTNLKLGELAASYAGFVNVLEFIPFSQNLRTDEEAISGLGFSISKINTTLTQQQRLRDSKNAELIKAEVNREDLLSRYLSSGNQDDGSLLLPANTHIKNLKLELKNLDSQIEKGKKELMNSKAKMLELKVEHESGTKEKIFQIKQTLTNLEAEIAKWKEQYLVLSPAEGKVSFFNELTENEFIKAGQELMVIVPESTGNEYYGQIKLSAKGSGKVAKGQKVAIKFDRYPFREFGTVSGEISKVYDVPSGDTYFLDVSLKSSLKTDKGLELEYQHNLSGSAEITTAKRTFLSRLFERLM